MALGDSISPAISVLRKLPLSRATSIWSRLLSTQYKFSPIQSTASPSAVASPVWTTTSMFPSATNNIQYSMLVSVGVHKLQRHPGGGRLCYGRGWDLVLCHTFLLSKITQRSFNFSQKVFVFLRLLALIVYFSLYYFI